MIPERIADVQPQEKRFYVHSNTLVHLELQKEAFRRGLNAWDLGGLVIQQWIEAGFPNLAPVESQNPCPSPCSSVAESTRGGQK